MARRRTRAELEAQAKEVSVYQEAFWALRRGEKPRKYKSGEHTIETLALKRAHGGLVLLPHGTVLFAERWMAEAEKAFSPYVRELAGKVRQAIREANEIRTTPGVQPDPRAAALVASASEATEYFSDDELEAFAEAQRAEKQEFEDMEVLRLENARLKNESEVRRQALAQANAINDVIKSDLQKAKDKLIAAEAALHADHIAFESNIERLTQARDSAESALEEAKGKIVQLEQELLAWEEEAEDRAEAEREQE